jgi:hypothetical protein
MNLSRAQEIINEYWEAQWESETPYTLENEHSALDKGTECWVRLTVRELTAAQESLGIKGTRRYRRQGVLFAQVFAPIDRGTRVSNDLAEQIRGIFEGETIGPLNEEVRFFNAQVRTNGPERNGRWHLTTVECAFWFLEIK